MTNDELLDAYEKRGALLEDIQTYLDDLYDQWTHESVIADEDMQHLPYYLDEISKIV